MHSGIKKWGRLVGLLMLAVAMLAGCAKGEDVERELTAKARTGDREAQYELARLYFDANGVDHSDKKAEVWIRKAAEQGHAAAQLDLATMYAHGVVVRKSPVDACKWLILSARQGFGPAMIEFKKFEATLTPEQIQKAQSLADDWKPKTS